MSTLKTSILLELQDKFSKQFSLLQNMLGKSEGNTNKLSKALGKNNDQFKKGSKEVQNYNNNFNNFKEHFKKGAFELRNIALPIIGISKLSNMLKNNLREAGNRQMLSIKLSTVMGNNVQADFDKFFRKIERTGIASFQEIVDTGYNLLSAGLSGEQAKLGTQSVINVAKVTGGQSDLVASTMATASKNFNLDMARVGDILAKTQLKFQFANFAQLGAGFDLVGASASAIKLPLEQTATALGMLNDAGIAGSSAGTALSAVLRQMNTASQKLGIEITRTSDGSLDLVSFLGKIKDKTKGFNLDKQAAIFQDLFGDEGKKGLLPLIANLDKMSANLADVSKNSKGITDKEVLKFYDAYNTKMAKLSQSISQLSGTLGKVLLPALTIFIDKLADGIGFITEIIEANNAWAWGIYGVVAALAAWAAKVLILKTLGFLNMLFGFTGGFLWLRNAIMLTTGAIRIMTLAMISNPIGAAIWLLTSGAILLIMYWKEVKAVFVDLWNWFSNTGFFKVIEGGIKVVSKVFGIAESKKPIIDNTAVNKVAANTQLLKSSGQQVNNNQKINITINSLPNQNEKDLAAEVMKQFEFQNNLSFAR
ncbi:Phage tail tape measure protein [Candidatus Hepatincolaceae symbiont of Richtersius coronifer]